jgi:hypothetical protein
MRWQTTAVLAVILIALGAFYYVYEIRLGPDREKATTQKGRLFTAEPRDVNEVEIKRSTDVVRLAREGEGWRMLEPVKTRGDRGTIDETVTTIVMAKMDREIASAPASLTDFGLEKPAAEVTLQLKDGKQLALLLGAKNPTGVWVYAKEKDRPPVVVVPETVLRDATRPLADFRDKNVLTFDRSAVTAAEIVTRDETLALESADGKWKLARPVALAADTDLVREFLDKLGGARVKEFVAESPPSLQPFGLDRPFQVAIHTGRDKERSTKSLLLGRLDQTKKGVYAMRPGEPSVLLLPEELWTALPKNVAVLRDKTVVEFDRDKVTRVELESPKGQVTVARENNRWTITAPEALRADQVEVGALLRKARELKALAFLSEDAAAIARYLAKPEVRMTVTEEGGSAKTLLLAVSPERRGGQPTAYAAVAGRGPVVLVEGTALADVGRSLLELRDHTLIADVEPKDVKRVAVRSGGQRVVLERQSESEWRMLEPTKGAARGTKVDDILYMVRALKWKEIVAPGGGEPARYGLDAPTLEVTLVRADGTEVATLLVGKREGDRAYVRTKVSPTVFAVEASQLGEAPKVPDDFKG